MFFPGSPGLIKIGAYIRIVKVDNFGADAMEIKNLKILYGDRTDNRIFDGFSVKVKTRSVTAILAPSGTGKTTFLSFLAFPDSKKFKGSCDFNSFSPFVSCVFQEPRLFPWLSVIENVALPLRKFYGKKKRLELAGLALKENSLYGLKDKFPWEISGGEKGRVSIARAFAYAGFCNNGGVLPLLLLDEPCKSQDQERKREFYANLHNLVEKKSATVIFVTHSADEALSVADRILVFKGRPVCIAGDFDNPGNYDGDGKKNPGEIIRMDLMEVMSQS